MQWVQDVKVPGREADRSLPFNVKVNNDGAIPSLPARLGMELLN
jgi:hypothetical protein